MKYNILYVDPPWEYSNRKNNDPKMGGFKYEAMSFEELYNIGKLVNDVIDKDCIMFFWVTMPKLLDTYINKKTKREYTVRDIINSWGFKYITTAFTWVKLNPTGEVIMDNRDVILKNGVYSGMGHWTNGNSELCLLCKKGTPKRNLKNVKQIIHAPRGKHSSKPNEIRDRIVNLCGDLPRLEMFAREKVLGWDSIGYEITNNDIKDDLKNICKDDLKNICKEL